MSHSLLLCFAYRQETKESLSYLMMQISYFIKVFAHKSY